MAFGPIQLFTFGFPSTDGFEGRIAEELAPPAWLDVRALGASLAPLSGLMYALRRLPADARPEQVLAGDDELDRHALATLVSIRSGRVASRRDAVSHAGASASSP
jgi:hypothetical protein